MELKPQAEVKDGARRFCSVCTKVVETGSGRTADDECPDCLMVQFNDFLFLECFWQPSVVVLADGPKK